MLTEPKAPIVLLVEDSDDDAFFFRRTFQKSGMSCDIQHVTDGAQAIEFLRSALCLPQTIFLDLKMPVLNGFEVLDWMRTQNFATPVHVIVLSGSEQHEDRERAAQLGAADYLVKPLKVSDLQRVLQDICPQEAGERV